MGTAQDPGIGTGRRDAALTAPADSAELGAETVDSLIDRWLRSRTDVREVTLQGYRDVLVPVRNRLGDRVAATLTTSDVSGLADWMSSCGGRRGQSLSPRSVAATLGALSQVLDLAHREGTLHANVARTVERPRSVKRPVVLWAPEHIRQFQQHAMRDRLAPAWLLSLAGLRRAEVLGLRWQDVELVDGRLRIEQGRVAVTPTSDAIGGPTRGRARRTIQIGMVPGILPALHQLLERQGAEREYAGPTYHLSGLVVVDENGMPLRPAWYSERFAALCRAADVPTVPLRNIRCTAIDFLLTAGLRPESVRDWLGQEPEAVLTRCGLDAASVLRTR